MSSPKNPEGGWLPPKTKEFHDFWNRVQKEATKLFGVDEDGDACVVVDMTDRSRYERIQNLPVPRRIDESPYHPYGDKKWKEGRRDPKTKKYIHPIHTPEEEEVRRIAILKNKQERMRMITGNFEMACTRLQQMNHETEWELDHEIKAPEIKRLSRIRELRGLKEFHSDPVTDLISRGYEVDRKNQTYWWPKDDGLDGDVRIKKIPPLPADFDERMKELDRLEAYKLPKEKDL